MIVTQTSNIVVPKAAAQAKPADEKVSAPTDKVELSGPTSLQRAQVGFKAAVASGAFTAMPGVLTLVGEHVGRATGLGPTLGGISGLAVSMVISSALSKGQENRAKNVTADLVQGGLTACFGGAVPVIFGALGAVRGANLALNNLEKKNTPAQ